MQMHSAADCSSRFSGAKVPHRIARTARLVITRSGGATPEGCITVGASYKVTLRDMKDRQRCQFER
jgi:hypothetical protein